jgi:hypothetical protein
VLPILVFFSPILFFFFLFFLTFSFFFSPSMDVFLL